MLQQQHYLFMRISRSLKKNPQHKRSSCRTTGNNCPPPSYPPKGATLSTWQQRYHTIIQGASLESCCHSQHAASQAASPGAEGSHRCSSVSVTALSCAMSQASPSRKSDTEQRVCGALSLWQRRKVKRIKWEIKGRVQVLPVPTSHPSGIRQIQPG